MWPTKKRVASLCFRHCNYVRTIGIVGLSPSVVVIVVIVVVVVVSIVASVASTAKWAWASTSPSYTAFASFQVCE
jgi:hypothetical protein